MSNSLYLIIILNHNLLNLDNYHHSPHLFLYSSLILYIIYHSHSTYSSPFSHLSSISYSLILHTTHSYSHSINSLFHLSIILISPLSILLSILSYSLSFIILWIIYKHNYYKSNPKNISKSYSYMSTFSKINILQILIIIH